MLGCVLLVSGTSSHNLHSIFITQTSQVQRCPLPTPDHSTRAGRKKMAARGGGVAKVRPPIRRQMHASSHGGGVLLSPPPAGQRVEGGTGLLVWWRGMRSRPAGLLAPALPHRGRASGTRKKHCPPKRKLQQTGGSGPLGGDTGSRKVRSGVSRDAPPRPPRPAIAPWGPT